MLKTIAIVVVVSIAAILIYAATKPDSFRVQRTTTIQSPPDRILLCSPTCAAGAPGRPTRSATRP